MLRSTMCTIEDCTATKALMLREAESIEAFLVVRKQYQRECSRHDGKSGYQNNVRAHHVCCKPALCRQHLVCSVTIPDDI